MAAYALGVDLGTTYTAAAIGRGSTAAALQLGSESAAVPSVVVFRDDGDVIVGDAARPIARRANQRAVRASSNAASATRCRSSSPTRPIRSRN